MRQAQLRLAALLLLAGGALAGAATGGYALGAASSKVKVPGSVTPREARSEDATDLLRQIEHRLARLEARVTPTSPASGSGAPAAPADRGAEAAAAPEATESEEAIARAATSDPDVLLASQRLIDDVLEARGISDANKQALRETLPKLSLDDRMAAMDELGSALNRGEIEFDAREIF